VACRPGRTAQAAATSGGWQLCRAYNAGKAALIHLSGREREAEVAAAYPMKRLGLPEDIAKAATFLLWTPRPGSPVRRWSSMAA